ncbi:MAG: hypothetical protein JNJ59_19155 [Deltaproteobacteria bacterium]|nr:hypothetical protein [Deltaproteobacteria bacterium]
MGLRELVDRSKARLPALALVGLLAACGGSKGAAPDASAPDATVAGPRMEGEVRRSDRWVKVAPLILHDAKQDLATRCLLLRDKGREEGKVMPVCYERSRGGQAVTRILVIREKSLPVAMARLTEASDAVHFTIDKNGAIYQILDLDFAPRRDAAYRPDEIGVVSCDASGEAALLAALQVIYPDAKVETLTR